ncbi:Unknown protein [Striga hermonthica]|uniref:Uncharacterized protein n=1 Tax=Striga hermonthica TaxID=68872 RepID=A0A9N7R145_STRHE|nr:Unknown protein [Striga hermonthica]
MLRILSKTASSTGRSDGSTTAAWCDDVDLSTWELVSASQSDDEDLYSFDGDDVAGEGDGDGDGDGDDVIVAEGVEAEPDLDPIRSEHVLVTPCDVVAVQSLSASPPMTLPVEMTLYDHACLGDGDGDVNDEDDDDDGYDYDDELVPWQLKGRFGKERLRKLGKRGGPNPNKSKTKRMAFSYKRPGCLYGKHGFGVQHSFI